MYLEHYGLDQRPFRITPHTQFFFAGARRGATLDALVYAIIHDEGIVKVCGEVGSGKTMLSRVLVERLPDSVETLYLSNPTLGPDALLRQIADELAVPVASDHSGALLSAIQSALIERFAGGKRVVALIDEAHAMPPASLEQIRLLSNLESSQQKLLQIVLFGQPELNEILAKRDMRQLKDRITQNFRLDPLGPAEVAQYVDFRLRAAGYRGPTIFSPAAIGRISAASGGLSRRINVLADKAMLAAYSQNLHQISPRHVDLAIRDAEYPPLPTPVRRIASILALLAAAVLAAGWLLRPPALPDAGAPSVATTPKGATQDARSRKPETHQPAPQSLLVPTNEPRPSKFANAPSPVEPEAPAASSARIAGATGQQERPVSTTPGTPSGLGPLAGMRYRESQQWIRDSDDEHWFIQLHTVNDPNMNDLDSYITRVESLLGGVKLGVYATPYHGLTRVGVIYGDYDDRNSAAAALNDLPNQLRRQGAYLRQVKGLR